MGKIKRGDDESPNIDGAAGGVAVSTEGQQMLQFGCSRLCTVLKILLVAIVFLFLNYLIFRLLELILQQALLPIGLMLLGYYSLGRRVVTYLVFPGCFPLYARKLEVSYQEQHGKFILEQVREFGLCLDIFKSGGADAGMDDYKRT